MKALATAVAILTISAPGWADESFIEDEPTLLSEPELHATTRHTLELSDEQMDGVIAGYYILVSQPRDYSSGSLINVKKFVGNAM